MKDIAKIKAIMLISKSKDLSKFYFEKIDKDIAECLMNEEFRAELKREFGWMVYSCKDNDGVVVSKYNGEDF